MHVQCERKRDENFHVLHEKCKMLLNPESFSIYTYKQYLSFKIKKKTWKIIIKSLVKNILQKCFSIKFQCLKLNFRQKNFSVRVARRINEIENDEVYQIFWEARTMFNNVCVCVLNVWRENIFVGRVSVVMTTKLSAILNFCHFLFTLWLYYRTAAVHVVVVGYSKCIPL